MDVTLPTGEVIKGVPDDMSKADLVAKLQRNGYDTSWYKPEPAAAPVAEPAAPTERTVGQEAMRQIGLGGRALINALASPVTLGGNLIGKGLNAAMGREVFKPSTELVDAAISKAGLPEAQTGVEKFTQEAARTMFPAAKLENALIALSGKPIVSSALASGAVSGAAAKPGETGREALTGALGGGIGAGLGVGLGRAGSSLLPASEEARNLMKKGVVPTIGQGVDRGTTMGTIAGAIEDVASTSPFHYRQVAKQREAVNRQLREAVLNEATSEGLVRVPTDPIRQQIGALRAQAGSAFEDLNRGLGIRERADVRNGMLDLISQHRLGAADERAFSKFVADNYTSRFAHGQKLPLGVLDDIRARAWEESGKASGPLSRAYADLASGVDSMRAHILDAAGRPLEEANRNYSRAKILEEAAKVRNPNRIADDRLFSAADYNRIATKQGAGDELNTLGHDARILTQSPANPPRINRPLTIGNVAEGAAALSSGGVVPGLLYSGGKFLNNDNLRRYLLGDPELAQMVTDALRMRGATLGRASVVNPSNVEEQ